VCRHTKSAKSKGSTLIMTIPLAHLAFAIMEILLAYIASRSSKPKHTKIGHKHADVRGGKAHKRQSEGAMRKENRNFLCTHKRGNGKAFHFIHEFVHVVALLLVP